MSTLQHSLGIVKGIAEDNRTTLVLSKKQSDIIQRLDETIYETGIKLYIDTAPSEFDDPIACDVEHDEQGNMVGIGICHNNLCGYYTKITTKLKRTLLESEIIAHNGVSDFECLKMWGINVRDSQLVWDIYLIGHVMDSSLKSYGLKDMAKREIGISYPSYDDIVGKRGLKAERVTLDKQPLELTSKYNALDCWATYQLYLRQKKGLNT